MKTHHIIWSITVVLLLSSCAIVRQGEVGVKRKLGKINFDTVEPGAVSFNPFTTRVIKVPVRTMNIEINSQLPSKEGLNVGSTISILYRVRPDKAPDIIANIGPMYEDAVIVSVFRSASADVCSQFFAKDMHSSQRSHIEQEIANRMSSLLEPRGFEVEAVLLKTIQLPAGLAQAVEQKLEAEQDAQRMEFLLQKERLEAQRKMVEAEGIRDAQQIISQGLNQDVIQWQSIEAFKELAQSPNAKVIITNGETPMMIEPQIK